MTKAHDQVVRFQKESDDYQTCLVKAINDYENHPPFFSRFVENHFVEDVEDKKHANQQEKERVVEEFNAGVRVYNTMHP